MRLCVENILRWYIKRNSLQIRSNASHRFDVKGFHNFFINMCMSYGEKRKQNSNILQNCISLTRFYLNYMFRG